MALSLYDISVPSYLQTLGAVAGFLEAGRSHCSESNSDVEAVVSTRLHEDMWPFHDQIVSVAHHSLGCIRGLQAGLFQPPNLETRMDFAGLQSLVAEAVTEVEKFDRATVDALEGKDLLFKVGNFELQFAAEDFVMSFSLPNFYFHATTGLRHSAYAGRAHRQDGLYGPDAPEALVRTLLKG